MSETATSTEDFDEPGLYEIRIKGQLDGQWAAWFGGLTITLEDNGNTLLTGTVADQVSMAKVLEVVDQYGSPAVINTITLVGGQQVNLEVRILEAQRDAGRELGISWAGNVGPVGFNGGGSAGSSFSSFITSVISGTPGINLNVTLNALADIHVKNQDKTWIVLTCGRVRERSI